MTTIALKNAKTKKPEWAMAQPVDFTLEEGEHIAIVGRNAAGKSMLVDMITGRHPVFPDMAEYHFKNDGRLVSENIRYITFRDTYGGDNDRTYFLQQRWNQMEIDEETPTVGSKLEEAYQLAGNDTPERRSLQHHLYQLFHMEGLLDKYIILLSSGELRKFKLASSLFSNPRVLIMDNPFIGLDAQTRDLLKTLLQQVAQERHMDLMLVMSKTDDIPDFVDQVIEVKAGETLPPCSRADYYARLQPIPPHVLPISQQEAILSLPYTDNDYDCRHVVDMHHVSIRYDERTILSDLDWTVCNGERWALSGQNGSGKSTLLSLICADNPQSYACDITLFDRPRGTGESIWDIKKHIGYVSPEMHRSYKRNLPAIRIVASGLMDSIGLYAVPNVQDYDKCRWWMNIFGIGQLADKPFLQLSSGEQRLVLLARTFVKDPQLLILDEPLHGLDLWNRRLVKDVIETFCQRRNKTMMMVTHYQEELPDVITHQKFLARNL